MAEEGRATSQVSSDSVVQSSSSKCSNGTPLSNADQSAMSFEEEEDYARDGMITFLTDPGVAIEHFREGMRRGTSPLIHYGYAFAVFIRGVLSFNEPLQEEANKVLEAAAAQCHQFRKSMLHSLWFLSCYAGVYRHAEGIGSSHLLRSDAERLRAVPDSDAVHEGDHGWLHQGRTRDTEGLEVVLEGVPEV